MGVDAGWLAARTAADDRARQPTVATLLPALAAHLGNPTTPVLMIDVGAGSGANQRWLSPRLPFPQHWVHLDHDPAILEHTHDVGHTEFVVGGVDALAALLDRDQRPTVITCAAVLDVLTRADLAVLCDLLSTYRVPALLSLSVTGSMSIDAPDAEDAALLGAFNAHQRRGGRAGPDAPDLVVAHCRSAGSRVESVPTSWLLDADSDPAFVSRFLSERVDAAVEQEPALREAAGRWLGRRLAQLSEGRFRAVVGHCDLLILPELSASQTAMTG